MRIIAVLLMALCAKGADITWTKLRGTAGLPPYNGWFTWPYNPATHEIQHYGAGPGANTIYSTALMRFRPAANTFSYVVGTSATANACTPDTATVFGERHPMGQMAVDSKRGVFWIMGGVDGVCQAPSGPDSNPRQDMYSVDLTSNYVQRYFPPTWPKANNYGSMVYDIDRDLIRLFGNDLGATTHQNWIYCPNNNGALIPQQTAAGCTRVDDWIEVFPTTQPSANWFGAMFYDRITKQVYYFGGSGPSGMETKVWTITTGAWQQKTSMPAVDSSTWFQQVAYKGSDGTFFYHQSTGSGAPRDFQYFPQSNAWVALTASGGGPTSPGVAAYDDETNAIYVWTQDPTTGIASIWRGQLQGAPPAPPTISTVVVTPDQK
jgi:hypothetical protein